MAACGLCWSKSKCGKPTLRLLFHEVHLIKRVESMNRFDDLETALGALNPLDASFSRRGSLPTIR